jgi:hypothetical protein
MSKKLFLSIALIVALVTANATLAFADSPAPAQIVVDKTAHTINSFSGDISVIAQVQPGSDIYIDTLNGDIWAEDEGLTYIEQRENPRNNIYVLRSPARRLPKSSLSKNAPWPAGTYTYRIRKGNSISSPEAVSPSITVTVSKVTLSLKTSITSQIYKGNFFSGKYNYSLALPAAYEGSSYNFPGYALTVTAYTAARKVASKSYSGDDMDRFCSLSGTGLRPDRVVFSVAASSYWNAATATITTALKIKTPVIKAKATKYGGYVNFYANQSGTVKIYKGSKKIAQKTVYSGWRIIAVGKLKGTHKLTFKFVPKYSDIYKIKNISKKIKII